MAESPHLRKMSSRARRMLCGAPGLETKSKTDLPSSLLSSRSDLLDCCSSKRNWGVAAVLAASMMGVILRWSVARKFAPARSNVRTTCSPALNAP